jgi:hypothetical protein
MDTWMLSGMMLKIDHVKLQIPSFGKLKGHSACEGPLENDVKD